MRLERRHSIAVRLGVGSIAGSAPRAFSGVARERPQRTASLRRASHQSIPASMTSLPTPENAHVTDPSSAPITGMF